MSKELQKQIEIIKNDIDSLNEIVRDLMDRIQEVLK